MQLDCARLSATSLCTGQGGPLKPVKPTKRIKKKLKETIPVVLKGDIDLKSSTY
jgi:hypothetical protein